VGDQFISEHSSSSLAKVGEHQYEDFKHKDMMCGNYFSFVATSPRTKNITAFLALFPTSEVERVSKVTSAGERQRPEAVFPSQDPGPGGADRDQHHQEF
jgi:hypothetical protein